MTHYMTDLWSRIEELKERLLDDPEDDGVALLLDACLSLYKEQGDKLTNRAPHELN
jgi:hypothetical protein